ncbi:MAG: ABC transporter ATP-binding protein [Actinobacteria bacterium]|nr:ABC transporter ATP-binding protein [Actinomycetota bacterium]NIT94677.1 ABC transporter ATP-binding protein [Actinomycetota bacterium]NIU18302.1 ABC transporter ATP-binding protein [Actinomycetota bacterium]NIU65024.1 ABC transporter ATP-binding protein [Actinomycetota bacterium]NIV54792.1 sn-glycerol-3-phosphate ABC transporter ATP-binding protein UgpC [Actinomycetota bacterium]
MGEIELDAVRKVYGDDVIGADDVTLTVGDGELVVLVGPSGSGKSTTLRMIAGLEKPSGGDIYIDGERVNDVEPQDRDIAMVFQSFALYPHRTVRGNIAFPLQAADRPAAEIDERVEHTAEVLGISELLDRHPSQLSGGQQQRVALGRAIVREPRVFLMDEPLANLDAKLRKEMRVEVVRLQKELGTTMVYVTHDQEEAMTMGDRIAVMNEGRLQQVAAPQEVYREPANLFVAGFIGSPSMNLLPGTVEGRSFSSGDGAIEVDLPDDRAANATADELTLGIRPENVEPVDEPGPHTYTGEVDVVENMGNLQIVYFQLGDGEFLAEVDPDHAVTAGDELTVRLQPGKLHLFDGTEPESDRLVP